MNNKLFIVISGIMGFSAVAFGAFGTHALKSILSQHLLETYKTGVFYHLIHTVVLLVISFAGKEKFIKSFWFFLAGIILFSFSLYIYAVTEISIFAMVTPVGGISLLIGWVFLIIAGMKKTENYNFDQ